MTPRPSKQGFFIAGTDTGVGKTLVAVQLTRALVARGVRVAVMKPVAAGVVHSTAGDFNDDALALAAASNVTAPYADVNPWLLRTPASPHLAARADGVEIRHEPILEARDRLLERSDVLVVEGAGGWHAPISATATMADIASRLGFPVVLVVGLRLGCLSHALLTREAIRASALPFAGWVANLLQAEMPLASANIETLSERFGRAPLATVEADFRVDPKRLSGWAMQAAENLLSP